MNENHIQFLYQLHLQAATVRSMKQSNHHYTRLVVQLPMSM